MSSKTSQKTRVLTRTRPLLAVAEGDWLCAWCHSRVADDADRFSFDGQDEFAFANPDGVRFEIVTFNITDACDQAGVPTLKYTWFEEHAWSCCLCHECGQHLGWYYEGVFHFVGLIKARLVRGVHVRN